MLTGAGRGEAPMVAGRVVEAVDEASDAAAGLAVVVVFMGGEVSFLG
jgi:hypothetical protein